MTKKKEPKRHEVESVQDMADCVTVENIDDFITDLKGVLLSHCLVKLISPSVKFQKFTWIEDGKHEICINVTAGKLGSKE